MVKELEKVRVRTRAHGRGSVSVRVKVRFKLVMGLLSCLKMACNFLLGIRFFSGGPWLK
jgi:hypothetical protein